MKRPTKLLTATAFNTRGPVVSLVLEVRSRSGGSNTHKAFKILGKGWGQVGSFGTGLPPTFKIRLSL